ncbi:hypothetical protein LJC46_04280 [Desulfovibrio sp. OttesenSCG-928-G15]|nr:hypothetical protein [Desulfovibrio sp. OttesenSCG-928-G15]
MSKPAKDHPWRRPFLPCAAAKEQAAMGKAFYSDLWDKAAAKKRLANGVKSLTSKA